MERPFPRRSYDGIEAIRSSAYGLAGARSTSRAGPSSTICPAYITAIRSAVSATMPRSWVISISAVPRSLVARRRRSSTCAWIVTSRAVVGSSAMISSGSPASAMAIIARWRMPPESWCGYCLTRCGACAISTSSRYSIAFLFASRQPARPCATSTSAICSPMVVTGLSAESGSWKIMEMPPPRTLRMYDSGLPSNSSPRKMTEPVTID